MTNTLPAPPPSGAFAKFATKGDKVVGHLLEVRGDGSTMNGEPCPLLVIDTGDDTVKITCSQAQLWSKTVELHTAGTLVPGRKIKVELTDIERRPNGRTLKHFAIDVKDDPDYQAKVAAQDEDF